VRRRRYSPDTYLLTSMSPRNTGLPVTVYARLPDADGRQRGMTLFVSAGSELDIEDGRYAVLAIEHDPMRVIEGRPLQPGLMKQVASWVSLNRVALHDHWLGHLDSVELGRQLHQFTT